MRYNRKFLSLILTILMVVSMVPFASLAETGDAVPAGNDQSLAAENDQAEDTDLTGETDESEQAENGEISEEQSDASEQSEQEPAQSDQPEEENDGDVKTEEPAEEDLSDNGEENNAAAMPEQTFEGKDGDVEVSVEAPEGAFPEGTEMTVTEVDDKDVLKAVGNAIEGEVKTVKAVDITFSCADLKQEELQPEKPIKVTLKTGTVAEAESPVVVHVDKDDDGKYVGEKVDEIETDVEKEEVSFEAEKFSVYAVVEESTSCEARAAVNFRDKNGGIIDTVYVKNADTLAELETIVYDPGAGVLADGDLFRGWTLDPNYDVETESMSIEDVREYLADLSITEGDEINLYAMVFKAYSVQFKDEDGVTIHSETLINKSGEDVRYTINTLYTPKSQDSAFLGWNVSTGSDKIAPAPSEMTDGLYPNGTEVTVTGNIIFTPDAPEGYWLVFDENGSGVSYTSPQFIRQGNTPTRPADPTRLGYTFGGWYKDEACTDGNTLDFSQELTQRTTVYAKWTPKPNADYTVIVWKQSVNDNYDAADADKTYDYAFSTTLTAASNTAVSSIDLSAYTGLDGETITIDGKEHSFFGFLYNTTKGISSTDTTVNPNGTTVVNIYYDREVVTYDFNVYGYTYTISHSTSSDYYYIPDGSGGYTRTYLYRHDGSWYRDRYYWWGWNYIDEYTGDVYERSQGWDTRETFTGLYGQKLSKYGYTWPTDYRWFISSSNQENTFQSIMDIFAQSVNRNPSDEFHSDFYGRDFDADTNVRHYLQNEDESWPSAATYTVPTVTGNGMTFRSFSGFTPYQYRIRLPNGVNTYYTGTAYRGESLVDRVTHYTNNGWTDWLDAETCIDFYGNQWYQQGVYTATDGGIEFRYSRNKYDLSYMSGKFVNGDGETPTDEDGKAIETLPSGTPLKTVEDINYEASLASYAEGGTNYYEPAAINGFSFAGWYIDPECTTKADLENMTMPLNGTILYGKWVQTQYRVFMHPNVPSDDTSLDWGGQEMSFRVNSGEHVAGGNTIIGTRDEYELIGWYTDEACTNSFNFSAYVLNDTTVKTGYDQTQSTELDKYGNPTENTNKDAVNNRFWITKKLDLYAKWRAKLDGAKGIDVIYSADDTKNNKTGTNAPTDTLSYLDSAEAVAGAASTPDDDNYQFLHWVVQTWDEAQGKYVDTDVTVFPGDTFTVLKANAHRTNNPATTGENDRYLYTVQLRAEYGPKDAPTPTHITWYDNFTENPVEDINYITDSNLQINKAVAIEAADRFTRLGYKFLGWARVPTTDNEGNPLDGYSLSPKNLTEDDLYLVYHEDTNTFTAVGCDGNIHTVSQVAADEKYPYHDMYAVWEPAKYTITGILDRDPKYLLPVLGIVALTGVFLMQRRKRHRRYWEYDDNEEI